MVSRGDDGARRRLAAIFAADVVGYSREVALNEAGTLARVRALRHDILGPALAAHGGRLFKAMGDGFLADFPSAVEAVSCAVAVQRELLVSRDAAAGGSPPPRREGLALRIGVAVGDVVVVRDGDVLGDGVNLAARLQAAAEPGEVVVSRVVHEQLQGRLDLPFEDRGDHVLKNIPGTVRLFALPAAAIAALPSPVRSGATARDGRPLWWRRRSLIASGSGAAVAAVGGGVWWVSTNRPADRRGAVPGPASERIAEPPPSAASAPRMSIAVLPFTNLGGDPSQDYVADGVTDDLIGAVGRFSHALVIGRGTAFTYKGRAADARQVGRELGVRYVVEGSVRRTGDRLRVNAQLVDAATGAQLWAEALDEPFGELSRIIGAVVSRIAAALNYRILAEEASRAAAERPEAPDALDLILRGRALQLAVGTSTSYGEARRLFERAVQLDPNSAQAHALLAHILTGLWSIGAPEDEREGLLRDAEKHAARALALDPSLGRAHYIRGVIAEARRRFDLALAAFDLASEINPNFVFVHVRRGWVLLFTDRPAEGAEEFRRAIAISPREPGIGAWHNGLVTAALMLGHDDEALGHAVRAAAAAPGFHWTQLLYASCLALARREEEARAALAEFRRLRPDWTATTLRRFGRERSGHPLYVATQDRLADALTSIGLPEG